MTSILFLTETIWRNQFGRNYLKNKKLFLNFFLNFEIDMNFEHLRKKDDLHSWFICQITLSEKRGLDICPKSLVSKAPLTGNMVNAFKHCCDPNHSTVTIFSDHLKVIESEKVCFNEMQSV